MDDALVPSALMMAVIIMVRITVVITIPITLMMMMAMAMTKMMTTTAMTMTILKPLTYETELIRFNTVNSMVADALALCVASTSAPMI